MVPSPKTYVVEHLDEELGPWSELEYLTIAKESHEHGAKFCLSSLPSTLDLPVALKNIQGFTAETRSVEVLYAENKSRVCLLDPAATKELAPSDGDDFDIFLFGGILGDDPPRGIPYHECGSLWKSRSLKITPDRTSELRKKGYEGRCLGPRQMTTDTAVRVTRLVVQDKISLNKVPYIDFPELRINKNESTEMPFRYVKGKADEPIMPEGMVELIKKDSEKGFGDML